jgi:hypothetical protein
MTPVKPPAPPAALTARGLPAPAASALAAKIAQLQGGNGNITAIPAFIRADFAEATRYVLDTMAGIMAVAALVALRGLRRGRACWPRVSGALHFPEAGIRRLASSRSVSAV